MVQSTFEMREDVRQARKRIFGTLPRSKTPTRGANRVLRQPRKGPALLEWWDPRVDEYGFAGHESMAVESKWQEEQFLNRLGQTTREGKQKPFRDELNRRMKAQQFNESLEAVSRQDKREDGDGEDNEK